MSPPVISATGLVKRYGDHVAVSDVDLSVPRGQILAVLGPNGAGKSTTVRILTTMTRPDAGSAVVDGIDILTDPAGVRRRIGVTGQDASLDELLTGRQNLQLIGRLAKAGDRSAIASRAVELLDQFELTDAADRMVKTYSGGMRRRLDLAASLVTRPPVLFLDEPTTGLDPTSRQRMWDVIRALVAEGTTVLLTTQYLDEADVLADDIVVIDHGRVIARGTAEDLKRLVGDEHVHLTLSEAHGVAAAAVLAPLADGDIDIVDDHRVIVPAATRPGLVSEMIRRLDTESIRVDQIESSRPSLDDVFFHLTGHPVSESETGDGGDVDATPSPVLEGSPA